MRRTGSSFFMHFWGRILLWASLSPPLWGRVVNFHGGLSRGKHRSIKDNRLCTLGKDCCLIRLVFFVSFCSLLSNKFSVHRTELRYWEWPWLASCWFGTGHFQFYPSMSQSPRQNHRHVRMLSKLPRVPPANPYLWYGRPRTHDGPHHIFHVFCVRGFF